MAGVALGETSFRERITSEVPRESLLYTLDR
jgi:hypothetical protein